jgi:hypothetical protein
MKRDVSEGNILGIYYETLISSIFSLCNYFIDTVIIRKAYLLLAFTAGAYYFYSASRF